MELYNCVISRYRDIGDPYLTIVAPSQLYSIRRHVLDHHHTLSLLASSFQYDIVPSGFLYRQQVNSFAALRLDANR